MVVSNTLQWEVTKDEILLYHAPLREEILLITVMPPKLGKREEPGESSSPGSPSCLEPDDTKSCFTCTVDVSHLGNTDPSKHWAETHPEVPLTCSALCPYRETPGNDSHSVQVTKQDSLYFQGIVCLKGPHYDCRQMMCLRLLPVPFQAHVNLSLCVCTECHSMCGCVSIHLPMGPHTGRRLLLLTVQPATCGFLSQIHFCSKVSMDSFGILRYIIKSSATGHRLPRHIQTKSPCLSTSAPTSNTHVHSRDAEHPSLNYA